jgi:hypothetical protein
VTTAAASRRPATAAAPAPGGAATRTRRGGRSDFAATAVLIVVGAVLMARPLGPRSLWIDDAWIALVVRADGLADVLLVGLTAPGFAALLAGVFSVAGFSELTAQAVPYAFGVVAAPALYLVARRSRLGRPAALLAAGLLLSAPELLTHASRVKQFTAEAVVVVVLLGAGAAVLRSPAAPRRWALLLTVSVVGTTLSSATAVTAAAAFAAGGLAALRAVGGPGRLRSSDSRTALRPVWWAGAVFTGFAVLWALLVLVPSTTPTLREYWVEHYSWRAVFDLLLHLTPLPAAVSGGLLVLSGVLVVRRDPVVAVLLAGPLLLSVALAQAGIAPVGGGRTDIHLYPSLALLAGTALDSALGRRRDTRPATALVAVLTAALVLGGPGPGPYPPQDAAPYIALVDREGRPGDVVLVYADTRWAFALYTERPVTLRPDAASMTGFEVDIAPRVPGGADLVVLPDANLVPTELLPAVRAAADGPERVWFLMSHLVDERKRIERALRRLGLEQDLHLGQPGAAVTRWVRSAD